MDWPAGDHELAFELQPLTPDEKQTRTLSMQITSVTVRGPMAKEYWVQPKDYRKFFPEEGPGRAQLRAALTLAKLLAAICAQGVSPARRSRKPSIGSWTLAEKTYSAAGQNLRSRRGRRPWWPFWPRRDFLFLEERPEKAIYARSLSPHG